MEHLPFPHPQGAALPAHVPSAHALRRPCELRQQEKTRWCWAAVAESACATLRGKSPSQCAIATKVLEKVGAPDCCGKYGDACNVAADTLVALEAVGLGVTVVPSWVELARVEEVLRSNDQLLCADFAWDTGGMHAVLIVGCDRETKAVEVADPWKPAREWIGHDRFRRWYHAPGGWNRTYIVSRAPVLGGWQNGHA